MLVNNPMGSRRRRRFYHRAGVVPIPGDVAKEDFGEPIFFNYEMEPFDFSEEEDFQPTSRTTQGGKRRVNFITISSLHARLLDIIDSMIALAEEEDREKEKEQEAVKGTDDEGDGKTTDDTAPDTAQEIAQEPAEEAGSSGVQSSDTKAEKE